MKSNTELHDILRKKITATLRSFNLAYLKYLRTGKSYGHSSYATTLGIYVELYNEMFSRAGEAPVYSLERMLQSAMNECAEVIDAEHQQLKFQVD